MAQELQLELNAKTAELFKAYDKLQENEEELNEKNDKINEITELLNNNNATLELIRELLEKKKEESNLQKQQLTMILFENDELTKENKKLEQINDIINEHVLKVHTRGAMEEFALIRINLEYGRKYQKCFGKQYSVNKEIEKSKNEYGKYNISTIRRFEMPTEMDFGKRLYRKLRSNSTFVINGLNYNEFTYGQEWRLTRVMDELQYELNQKINDQELNQNIVD